MGNNGNGLIQIISTTVGKVIGLGIKSNHDIITLYDFKNIPGADKSFNLVCYNDENNHFQLFNRSENYNDIATISFSSIGNSDTKLISIPGRCSYDLNSLFKDNANLDSTTFQVTASSQNLEYDGKVEMACSAREIPVNGIKYPFGSYFNVEVMENNIIFSSVQENITLNSISFLCLKSSGDSEFRIFNIPSQNQMNIEISLPEPLISGILVDIDAVINFTSQKLLNIQKNRLK
ncbi:MAG: hypothetical protein LBM96_07340 [Methanobrevibacter sp.]|jgi:hypothetical protein|nr:hypothetical protein [Candidatus Methanoflexus mossambicus]